MSSLFIARNSNATHGYSLATFIHEGWVIPIVIKNWGPFLDDISRGLMSLFAVGSRLFKVDTFKQIERRIFRELEQASGGRSIG